MSEGEGRDSFAAALYPIRKLATNLSLEVEGF